MEEKGTNALEMATKENEKREKKETKQKVKQKLYIRAKLHKTSKKLGQLFTTSPTRRKPK